MKLHALKKPRSAKAVAAAASLATVGALTVGLLVSSLGASAQTSDTSANTPTQSTTATTAPLTEGGQGAITGSSGTTTGSGRIDNVNTNLVLRSATVVRENLNDTEAEYVQFEFGHPVNHIISTGGFTLQGFATAAKVDSTGAQLVQGDPNGVLAQYTAGTDVARFTLATVNEGVVADEVNKANIASSVPLSGAQGLSAATDAPMLTAVRAIPTLEQVEYIYDRQVGRNASGNASDLGFYTLDGRAITASSVVTSVDNVVTAQFPSQVEDGALFFSRAGAVKGARGLDSMPGSVGRSTTAPNLVSVSSLEGKTQFDFTFDRPVSDIQANLFSVYNADGTKYQGEGSVQPSSDVVRVAFPQVEKYGKELTLASVDDGAAKANDGSATPSTLGTRQIGSSSVTNGRTSGPNLVSASIDNATGQIRFTFDKVVDDNKTYDPANFSVVTQSGDIVQARNFVEVNGDSVLVTFDRNVAAAAQDVSVASNAVEDFQGLANPVSTLGV